MQTTKGQILALLKRRGHQTVEALTEQLGLAPMTVRQHLTSLERDGLVQAASERQPKGRPRYVYSLTEKGEETFPKHYDRLAAQVLGELGRIDPYQIAGLGPAERTAYIVVRIADRTVAQHLPRLRDLSLEERVREVAAILQDESGFVEWEKGAGRYEIRDHNCIYRPLTDAVTPACAWHQRILGQLLGLPPVPGLDAVQGGSLCRYAVLACDQRELPGTGQGRSERDGMKQVISEEVH